MSKHTPGPWKFEIPWAGFSAIRGPENQLIFGVAAGDDDERRPEPEIEANARLISAAPDLLEALERIAEETAATWVTDIARAAIAKAKGESDAPHD